MSTDKLASIIQKFSATRILVIGDLILDRYLFGGVDRISPEAPIPIVLEQRTSAVPGGAANTAANVAALGAHCSLVGAIGNDQAGIDLIQTLIHREITTNDIATTDRVTTEKMRVIGNQQQIVRVDREQAVPLSPKDEQVILKSIAHQAEQTDAIVICDYAKGVISELLLNRVRELANQHQIPVLADVRPEHSRWYHDLTLITPNKNELARMTGQSVRDREDAQAVGTKLAQSLRTTLLVTLSEEGLLVVDKNNQSATHFPTKAIEVTDVSGAGDTVMAACALALATGADLDSAAEIANYAASVVVAKHGTATVSQEELLTAMGR